VTDPAGLFDTSVWIALERGRALDRASLPSIAYVAAITAGELELAVHTARDPDTRAHRMRTWTRVTALDLLDVDLGASHEWARLRFRLGQAGRSIGINDLWIAAIALANELPVVTQDADFDVLSDLGGPRIIRV